METVKGIIISLFDYSGSWSLPYEKAGYMVIRVDIKHGIDILTWDYMWIPRDRVAGILMAPPCTHFTVSCNRLWDEKDADGRTAEAVALVEKAMEIKRYFNPVFWGLENPVGRIASLVPELGEPWYFHPNHFGDCWTKKTGIWGEFNKPKRFYVTPYQWAPQGSWSQILGGKSERTKEIRSVTPWGFARAFFQANNPAGFEYKEEYISLFGRCRFGLWTCHFAVAPGVCEHCEDGDSYEPDEYAMTFGEENEPTEEAELKFMLAIFDKGEGILRSIDPQRV